MLSNKEIDFEFASEPSFSHIGQFCFGRVGKLLVDSLLVFTQFGFASSYTIYVATNLNILVPQFSFYEWAFICLPGFVFLCLIRTFKYLG